MTNLSLSKYQLWKKHRWLLVAVFLFLILAYPNAVKEKIEPDQSDYINYALRLLQGNSTRLADYNDASCMPVMVLAVIPRIAEQLIKPGLEKKDWGAGDLNSSRKMMLFWGIIGLFIFYWFLQKNFNEKIAAPGVLMLGLSPTYITRFSQVNTDAFALIAFILVLHCFFLVLKKNNLKNIILLSLAVAFAQLCKTTFLHLYILLALWAAVYILIHRSEWKLFLKGVVVFLFIQIVVINAGYLFNGFGQSKSDIEFGLSFFKKAEANFFLGNVFRVLPAPFLLGIDQMGYMDLFLIGSDKNTPYPFFNYRVYDDATSPWFYYFAGLFLKTPFLLFLLFCYGIVISAKKKMFNSKLLVLLVTGIYFLLYFSFFFNSKNNVRFASFLAPVFYVLGAIGFLELIKTSKRKFVVLILLPVTFLFSSIYFWGRHAEYINEMLVFREDNRLLTSPLLFGGSITESEFNKVWERFPEFTRPPLLPSTGLFIATAHEVAMKYHDKQGPYWLIRYKPFKIIDREILLYKIDKIEQ